MAEVPVDEQKSTEEATDVEVGAVDAPLLGEILICILCKDAGNLVLIEPVS